MHARKTNMNIKAKIRGVFKSQEMSRLTENQQKVGERHGPGSSLQSLKGTNPADTLIQPPERRQYISVIFQKKYKEHFGKYSSFSIETLK